MKFASARIEGEWNDNKLKPILKEIVADAVRRAAKEWDWEFFLTSIFRRKEEDEKLNASGIHVEWRAVDVRTKDPKGIDGLPGPGTNAALRDFQQEHDLPTSNVIDEQLLSFMKEKIEALDKTE